MFQRVQMPDVQGPLVQSSGHITDRCLRAPTLPAWCAFHTNPMKSVRSSPHFLDAETESQVGFWLAAEGNGRLKCRRPPRSLRQGLWGALPAS